VYILIVNKLTVREREKLRATLDDDIINSSIDINPHALPNFIITKGREQDFLDASDELRKKGCNPFTLEWSLRLGRAALRRSLPSAPSAKVLKGVVKRLDEMACEIREIEKSGFLTIVVREEVETFFQRTKLTMDDVENFGETLPQLDLPRWMKKKADMYRGWLTIASLRVAPKGGRMLTRLEYLYPALYVRKATGEPCLPLLMRLFETIGIAVSREQLTREFTSLKQDYKWLRMDMESKLYIVGQRTSNMYEEELAAFGAKIRELANDDPTQTKILSQGTHREGRK
jgi:hypothetical protein